MLLLTDGTVFCQEEGRPNWWRLTPDAFGSYINGAWSKLAQTPGYAPMYYASAILPDGSVFVAGGEYNDPLLSFGATAELLVAKRYDPVQDAWTDLPVPSKWDEIGDAPCCVLPDGTVLLGSNDSSQTAIYDPVTNTWRPTGNKEDSSSEETWTLLRDNTVLTVECSNSPKAEKYLVSSGKWVSAGNTAGVLVQSVSLEIGPALLLPDGSVFAIGATGHTALYNSGANPNQPGTWVAGPDFPNDSSGKIMEAKDAPACLLPNGHVMCVAGPNQEGNNYDGPTQFFDFDGTMLTEIPNPQNNYREPFHGRMLLLPTGQVLFSNGSSDVEVFTPSGSPESSWRPTIVNFPSSASAGQICTITGTQLNGLSQAVSYGDDASMATNYPLVRVRKPAANGALDQVWYCRTFNFSTMAVATGTAVVSTDFQVPQTIETFEGLLEVVANGIVSEARAISIKGGTTSASRQQRTADEFHPLGV